MINTDRIVPVVATDLVTLYGTILKAASVSVTKLAASGIGIFTVSDNSATVLANEPVKKLNFASGVTAGTVYFVPDYDFAKTDITVNGAAATVSGTVDADGCTLYTATLSSGTVTLAKVGI